MVGYHYGVAQRVRLDAEATSKQEGKWYGASRGTRTSVCFTIAGAPVFRHPAARERREALDQCANHLHVGAGAGDAGARAAEATCPASLALARCEGDVMQVRLCEQARSLALSTLEETPVLASQEQTPHKEYPHHLQQNSILRGLEKRARP